jgi:nucleotide-binding universal stress UspA family protein
MSTMTNLADKETETAHFSPKRILVPVNESDKSKKALKIAAGIARTYGSELILLNVTTTHSFAPQPLTGEEQTAERVIQDDLKLASEVSGKNARGKIVWTANVGVGGKIVESAIEEKADLIVIGSRGLSGIKRVIEGSVAGEVLAQAPCPVLVEI